MSTLPFEVRVFLILVSIFLGYFSFTKARDINPSNRFDHYCIHDGYIQNYSTDEFPSDLQGKTFENNDEGIAAANSYIESMERQTGKIYGRAGDAAVAVEDEGLFQMWGLLMAGCIFMILFCSPNLFAATAVVGGTLFLSNYFKRR